MAIIAGVAVSKNSESFEAGYEAGMLALEQIQDRRAQFLLSFFTVNYEHEQVFQGIQQAAKGIPFFGCSSGGIITNEGVVPKGVAVMAIQSKEVSFFPEIQKVEKNAPAAGKTLTQAIKKNTKDLSLLLSFPNVLLESGSDTLTKMQEELGTAVPIVGGAVADDFSFQAGFQFTNREISDRAIGGIGISGALCMGIGADHGWLPVGIPVKVTNASGNVVYTIDHKPAISMYEEYFGKSSAELSDGVLAKMAFSYPLAFRPQNGSEYLIRSPLKADDDGALFFTAEVPEGAEVRLMIGTQERAKEAAKNAAKKVKQTFDLFHKKAALLLLFSCISRKKLFGDHAKDEIDEVRKIFGNGTPLLGFYGYGNIAFLEQHTSKKQSIFQNATMTLLGIG